MKQNRIIFTGIFFLMFLMLAGCTAFKSNPAKKTSPPADILAAINGRIITVTMLQKKLDMIAGEGINYVYIDEKKKKEYLDNMVNRTLFALEARAQDIDKEKNVADELLENEERILARAYYRRKITPMCRITEDELENYYKEHIDEFTIPDKLGAMDIFIKVKSGGSQAEWTAAFQKAAELKKRLDNGADFGKLAMENSGNYRPRRRKGFSDGRITKDKIPARYPQNIFSLEKNEIIGPVKGAGGYTIIKIISKSPGSVEPFEKVKDHLNCKLVNKKYDQIYAKTLENLKEKYNVNINNKLLSEIKIEKKPFNINRWKKKKNKGCGCDKR